MIKKEIEPFSAGNNEYGVRDAVFSFGTVVADLGREGASDGVRANFKLTNACKVMSTVNFSIKPLTKGLPADAPFPITVEPKQLIIPPHEYRFATLLFHPRAILAYNASFEAVVENGEGNPKTARFACELQGKGVLPSLTVVEPSVISAAGKLQMVYANLLPGRSSRQRIAVRNNGAIPASARLEFGASKHFHVREGAESFTLQKGEQHAFVVEFAPGAIGKFEHEAALVVAQNHFENVRIALRGECFVENVAFSGLPNDSMDTLRLPDGPIGKVHDFLFALQNHSDKHYRFAWPDNAHVKITPAVGHLHARAARGLLLRFQANAAVKLDPLELMLACTEITYPGQAVEWDDTVTQPVEGGRGDEEGPRMAEPKVDVVKGGERKAVLRLHAVADDSRYTCSTKEVAFRSTMMFQTRVFQFAVANSGTAELGFQAVVQHRDGSEDASGLYAVEPAAGVIAAGASQSLTVRFAPVEVEDCERTLLLETPHLAQGVEPLRISLDGKVQRPWCHFEVRGEGVRVPQLCVGLA